MAVGRRCAFHRNFSAKSDLAGASSFHLARVSITHTCARRAPRTHQRLSAAASPALRQSRHRAFDRSWAVVFPDSRRRTPLSLAWMDVRGDLRVVLFCEGGILLQGAAVSRADRGGERRVGKLVENLATITGQAVASSAVERTIGGRSRVYLAASAGSPDRVESLECHR